MFKKNFKKVMGILLTLAVVISGLPIGSMVAYADEVETCTCKKTEQTITYYTAHKVPGGNLDYGATYYGYNDYICTQNKISEPVDGKEYTTAPAGRKYVTTNYERATEWLHKKANTYSTYYDDNRAGNFVNDSGDFILYYPSNKTDSNHLEEVSFVGGTYSYWSDGLWAGGKNRYYLNMNLYYFTTRTETKTVGNDKNPGAWTYNSTTGLDEQICQNCSKVCNTRTHEHDYTNHSGPTSNATCTEKGHDIWTCACGATTDKSTQNALGHDWKETSRTPATCTEDGVVNYVCVRDNGNGTCGATKSETLDKTGHSATHHDAVTLTTTTVGHPEYWTCSNSCCDGKKFKDAECTTELTDAEYNIQLPTSVKNFVDYANNNVLDPYKIGKNVEVEVSQALSAWNKLSDAEKAIPGVSTIKTQLVSIDNEYQTAASAKRAKDAQDAIDAIGTVHYTTESNNLIKEAEYAIYILKSYGEYTSFAAANEDRIKTLTDARDLYDGMNGLDNFNTQVYQIGNNIYNANLMDGSKNSSANIQNMINTLEENEDLFDNKYFAYRYNDTKTTYKSPLDTIDTDLPTAITRLKGELTKAQAREKDEADLATYKEAQKKALNEFVVPILAETNDAYDHEIELLLDTALSNIGTASDKDTVDNVVDAAKNDINKKLAEYRDNTSDKTKNKAEVKKYAEDELNNSLTDDLNDEELETLTKEIADLVKNYDGSDKDKDTVKKAIDDKIDAAEQKSTQNKADKEAKEKAQHLIDLINALPNPDTASDDDIINAADDIDNVTLSTSKDFYDNILNDINNENTHLVSDELLQKMSKDAARLLTLRNEVSNVEKAINALNNPVTLDDEDAVKNAREAYDELSDAQKNLVNSDVLKKLENAEKKLSNLKNEENEKTQAEKLKAELEKAQAEAEKAKAEAEKAQAELEKAKSEAEQAELNKQKIQAELEKAQKELEEAAKEAEYAEKLRVIELTKIIEINKIEVEKAKAELEKANAEREKAQAEVEKANLENELIKAEIEAVKTKLQAELDAIKAKNDAELKAIEEKKNAELANIELERQRLEAELVKAQKEVEKAAQEVELISKQIANEEARGKAEAEQAEIEKAKTEAEKNEAESNAKKAQDDAERAAIEKAIAQSELEKTKAELEIAKAELEKVKAEQEKAEAESKAQVESVIKLINSVEITKESIEKVRAAYEALDATQKAQINAETLKKLTDAETAYAQSIENNPQSTTKMNSGFKVSQTGKKVNVTWSEVEDADYYVVYANYCGKNTSVKYKTTTTNTSYSFTTMNGKKLDLTKNYKVQVKAYAIVNGEEVCVSKTVIGHIVGSKNTKYTNPKSIKVGSSNVTLTVGGISKIKATTVKVDSSKKILSDAHAKEFRYRSSDKSVCTVKNDGTIVAKSAGTAYVYVYAKNGYCKTIKVTVNGLTEGAARYRF